MGNCSCCYQSINIEEGSLLMLNDILAQTDEYLDRKSLKVKDKLQIKIIISF